MMTPQYMECVESILKIPFLTKRNQGHLEKQLIPAKHKLSLEILPITESRYAFKDNVNGPAWRGTHGQSQDDPGT